MKPDYGRRHDDNRCYKECKGGDQSTILSEINNGLIIDVLVSIAARLVVLEALSAIALVRQRSQQALSI
nr:hypothetical protein CFP56_57960 [Quercus suber]